MNRRQLMALLYGAAAARPNAVCSAERIRRVGFLMPLAPDDPFGHARVAAFREQLGRLGWTEGRNIEIDVRWTSGDETLSQRFARELVALAPDVLAAQSTQALLALRSIERAIPIVVANAADLVQLGVVESLAHPGGNVTGFTFAEFELGGKWVEALKAIAPHLAHVGALHDSKEDLYFRATKTAAPAFGVEVVDLRASDAAEIRDAITTFAREPNGGLIVHPGPLTGIHRKLIVALAATHGLPAVYPYRSFMDVGGLLSYGIDLVDMCRRAAGYVDLILRGARAADLPVQSAPKLELLINLRTAKALGLVVPPRLLARADEVIE
jgi:putative tryptophan/tyrosine transport system substrate-binding protein